MGDALIHLATRKPAAVIFQMFGNESKTETAEPNNLRVPRSFWYQTRGVSVVGDDKDHIGHPKEGDRSISVTRPTHFSCFVYCQGMVD
jgi:hypothetical protein